MNTDTGQIYRNMTDEQLRQLQARGEPVVRVSERVVDAVEVGMYAMKKAAKYSGNRQERRKQAAEARRGAK